jgi:hypothetical protein
MMHRLSATLAVLVLVSPSLWMQSARVVSRGGYCYATVEHGVDAKRWPEANPWVATIYHRERGRLYEISREVPFDQQFPALHVSDEGQSVLLQSFDGRIEFYDAAGRRVGVVSPFVDEAPEFERIFKCSLADDRAVFLFSSPLEKNVNLIMTNLNGQQKWKTRLPNTDAGEVFMSQSGNHILAGSYTSNGQLILSSTLLDGNGQVLRTFPFLFRYADVSTDDSRFVLSDRNRVVIGSMVGTDEPAMWSTVRKEDIVTEVRFVEDRIAVVVESVSISTGTPVYHDPTLVLLNEQARQVLRKQIESTSGAPAFLEVLGDTLTLSSGKNRMMLKLDRLEK